MGYSVFFAFFRRKIEGSKNRACWRCFDLCLCLPFLALRLFGCERTNERTNERVFGIRWRSPTLSAVRQWLTVGDFDDFDDADDERHRRRRTMTNDNERRRR